MKPLFALFCTALFAACNSTEEKKEATTTEPDTPATSSNNCYRYASGPDTITLKLVHVGDAITGTLVYDFNEKDDNKGTIQGKMKGDVLLADYTFMSEGTASTREVAFKLEGTTFVEGQGEAVEKNGKTVFKDPDALDFSAPVRLGEIDCK